MLRLYDFLPSGNCYKIRLLLTQLEIPFERVDINILKHESRTPEFLSKNLNGRVPSWNSNQANIYQNQMPSFFI
jgi:glutathione S-transferase